ncbi:hypothetical protein HIN52_11140, partial [Salmonella enterica subsp. enterica serovar Typhimurium]|nr:hypothetical protein [Salmonella enterica subsp. enterica serovar Typhimurium]
MLRHDIVNHSLQLAFAQRQHVVDIFGGIRAASLHGNLLGNGLIKGLRLVGQTFIWLGRALLMNPVGLTITAIASAAYL